MSFLNISVCDENRNYLEYLGTLLKKLQVIGSSVITYYEKPDWLVYDISSHEAAPDILIINIDLKKNDGIEIAEHISDIIPYCRIIFLCEENRVEPRCFLVDHSFILPKELVPVYLSAAVEKAVSDWKSEDSSSLCVISKRTHIILPTNRILFIERRKRKTIINMEAESIETYQLPQDLLLRLNTTSFLQCHKSYYVNTRHIKFFSRACIALDNGYEIPVGRVYYNTVANKFYAFLKSDSLDKGTRH